MGRPAPDEPPKFFSVPSEFRAWLDEHHASADQIWVGYYKKATGKPSVTWEDTVEEALCYGWIDGIRMSIDDERYAIRFVRRSPKSVWSKRNIELVERLEAAGRMRPAGREAFTHKDVHPDSGYRTSDQVASLEPDMLARFKATPGAWAFFQDQPPGYRRQAVRWVMSAKRDETRQRRLATLIDDSKNGLRIQQLRKR